MILYYVSFAVIVGLLLAFVFSLLLFRKSWAESFWVFFIFIFLAAWVAGLWVTPFGPVAYDVSWATFFLGGLLFALVLSAFIPPAYYERRRPPKEDIEGTRTGIYFAELLSVYFWLLVIFLVVAIVLAYI